MSETSTDFLLESPPKHLTLAYQNQATFNAIHDAVIRWDRSVMDTNHPGFNNLRTENCLKALRTYHNAIIIQPRPDHWEPNFGRTDFVQQFEGYLLYLPSVNSKSVRIESIGVNPDARRLSFGTRLIYKLSSMYPRSSIKTSVPENCLELYALLKKRRVRCERAISMPGRPWLFCWEGKDFL